MYILTSVCIPLRISYELLDVSKNTFSYPSIQHHRVEWTSLPWVSKLLPVCTKCCVHDGLPFHLLQGHLSGLCTTSRDGGGVRVNARDKSRPLLYSAPPLHRITFLEDLEVNLFVPSKGGERDRLPG